MTLTKYRESKNEEEIILKNKEISSVRFLFKLAINYDESIDFITYIYSRKPVIQNVKHPELIEQIRNLLILDSQEA